MFLVNRPRPARRSGSGGGLNVIVGCVPPLNGRSLHLIEAAKWGRLDQMIFFRRRWRHARRRRRLAGRPAERPAEHLVERPTQKSLQAALIKPETKYKRSNV